MWKEEKIDYKIHERIDRWSYYYHSIKGLTDKSMVYGENGDHFKITKLIKVLENTLNDKLAMLIWTWFTDKIEIEESIKDKVFKDVPRELMRFCRKKDQQNLNNLLVAADLCEAKGLNISQIFQLWLAEQYSEAELIIDPLLDEIKESENKMVFRLHGGSAWAPRKIKEKDLIAIEGYLYIVRDLDWIDRPNKRRIVHVRPPRDKVNIAKKVPKGTRMTWEERCEHRTYINPYKRGPQGDLLAAEEQSDKDRDRTHLKHPLRRF